MSETIVLIDDDKVIHQAWASSAKEAGVLLIAYLSIVAFLEDADLYKKETRIFIDTDLDGELGELVAEKLFTMGFNNLSLLKSFNFDRDEQIPTFIKEVTSKVPPF